MAARVDPIEALRGVNRSTSRSASLPRKTLVVMQAALSLALLSASGLLTGALGNLENQKFGFEQDHRTVVNLDPQLAGYRVDQLPAIHRQLEEAVRAIPGVASVAMCAYAPQSGGSWNDGVFVDGHAPPGPQDDNMASFERVTEGFFDAIGNPILRGRAITERDVEASVHVAVINEAFARKFFRGEDPVGKHFGRSEMGASRLYEVVGIARDARFMTYNIGDVRPFFFAAANQSDVFPSANHTRGDIPTHYMHDLVVVTRAGHPGVG